MPGPHPPLTATVVAVAQVCYYAALEESKLVGTYHDDDRCMGVWVRKDECKPTTPTGKDPTCAAVQNAKHVDPTPVPNDLSGKVIRPQESAGCRLPATPNNPNLSCRQH